MYIYRNVINVVFRRDGDTSSMHLHPDNVNNNLDRGTRHLLTVPHLALCGLNCTVIIVLHYINTGG